jgi:small-conductance mechanosensitive channel
VPSVIVANHLMQHGLKDGMVKMDEWKKVVQWAAREQAEEKQKEREHFKRTLRAWPMIAVAVVPFGWLAFAKLDATAATVSTVALLVVAVLVAEHLSS